MNGRLIEVTTQIWRKVTTVVIELTGLPNFHKWENCVLDVEIKPHRERRSLNANAYFHVLADKLAEVNTVSKTHQKNDLITSYGQRDYLKNGNVKVIKTNIPLEEVKEFVEPHLKFIKYSPDEDCAFYEVYRGSSTYDSYEMSKLIAGAVAEAQDAGIDTMTPDEIAKLTAMWKPKEES